MSRWWTERVAGIGDSIPLGLLALLILLAAALLGAGLYWWPAWLPRRWWPRPKRGRAAARPAADGAQPQPDPPDTEDLPDLPVEEFVSLADRLAAQGRYAEAIRERLRGIVRELVEARVIESRPGWTVTELATAAGQARPPVRPALDGASRMFSDIWYGQRPAGAAQDQQMRHYADQVTALLGAVPAGASR